MKKSELRQIIRELVVESMYPKFSVGDVVEILGGNSPSYSDAHKMDGLYGTVTQMSHDGSTHVDLHYNGKDVIRIFPDNLLKLKYHRRP